MSDAGAKPRRRKRAGPPPRPHPAVKRGVRLRLGLAAAVLCSLLAGLAVRAFSMQVTHAAHFRELANRQHLSSVEVPAPRGPIYDRRGVELAVTAQGDSIWANPREVLDPAGTAAALAEVLDIDPVDLEGRLGGKRYFTWIDRQVTPEIAAQVHELGLPGVYTAKEPRRFYPGRRLAGPVLGFANIDGRGIEGVELAMDDLLRGRRGLTRGVRDASGHLVFPDSAADARPGLALTLTLDRSIQFIAERALEAAIREHQAKAGVAVVLEVGTGDILAMADWPTYDPNHPTPGRGARNRAVTDAYEIGSVMKVFTVAAALEAGVVTPDTVIDVEGGRMRMGRNVIRDSFHDDELTVSGVIKRSSNIGALKIARRVGAETLHDALIRFRFGQRTGVELSGERAGLIRPAKRWRPSDLAVIGYGYGITVTPLQAIAGVAAIGNGGIYVPPRLVRAVRSQSGETMYRRRPEGSRIMSARVAGQMMAMMTTVFDKGRHGGTARSLDMGGFSAAGKTGTARKIDPATGGYGHIYLSSLVGVAPANDPKIAVLVAVDEPTTGGYYGAVVAGGAWATIVSQTLRYLGVPPDKTDASSESEGSPEPTPPETETAPAPEEAPRPPGPGEVRTPDFSGMGIPAALEAARAAGLTVEIRGSGRAVEQSPAPGQPSTAGGACRIRFALPEG